MSGIYVYAIIPAVNPKPFEVASLSPADPRVGTIRWDGLAAVVGAAPLLDFHALPREDAVRYLLAHQRVVEAVMRTAPTLPVKFGTILPDEAAVVSLLMRGKAVLAPRLAELAEHVQIELIVSWSLEQVLREIAAEDSIVRLKAEVAAQPLEATNDARVALGRIVKESIDRRRAAYRNRIMAALRPIVADLVENALMDDRMVANVALLLPDRANEAFDRQLAELDGEFEGRLNFRSVGPLPPSSFATVEVTLQSYEVVDHARRALRLGDSAKLIDIKAAYRRLIRLNHPDVLAAGSAGGGAAAKLTDAYKTLLSYADAQPAANREGASADGGYWFDRGAVECAMAVAVRRQDLPASRQEGRP
jgi:hypothetical protein